MLMCEATPRVGSARNGTSTKRTGGNDVLKLETRYRIDTDLHRLCAVDEDLKLCRTELVKRVSIDPAQRCLLFPRERMKADVCA